MIHQREREKLLDWKKKQQFAEQQRRTLVYPKEYALLRVPQYQISFHMLMSTFFAPW